MVESEPADLTHRSIGALRWNLLGNGVRMASQFVIGIVLARLLGPEAFGTVAIAWLMVGVGMLVADLGFGAALVQRPELQPRDLQFVLTMQVLLGTVLALTGAALAGLLAAFFRRPESAPVIRAMSLIFLVQSFGQAPLALLRRSLDFKAAQAVGIASYLLGYLAVGIPCAYLGMGAWSLVAAQLVQSTTGSLLAWRRSGLSLRPAWTPSAPGLFAFGAKVIGANLSSWGILNLDSLVVGRILGATDLGLYNRAQSLVTTPTATVTASLQGVLFAACSRAQGNTPAIRRAFLSTSAAVASLSMPVFATAAAVAETVVGGVYGSRWMAAAPALVALALAMPVVALLSLVGPILTSMNRAGSELRAQAIALLVAAPVLYLAAQRSIAAVAWGMLGVSLVRCLLLVATLLELTKTRWVQYLGALGWPALCAAATAAVTWGLDRALRGVPPTARLAADVAIALASLLVAVRLLGRRLSQAWGEDLVARARLPLLVRRCLGI